MQRDLEYRSGDKGALKIDVCYLARARAEPSARPHRHLRLRLSRFGFQTMLGCEQKEMESFIFWA